MRVYIVVAGQDCTGGAEIIAVYSTLQKAEKKAKAIRDAHAKYQKRLAAFDIDGDEPFPKSPSIDCDWCSVVKRDVKE